MKLTIPSGKTGIYFKVPKTDWLKCVAFVVGCNNINAALMDTVAAWWDPNVSQIRAKTTGTLTWPIDQDGMSIGSGTNLTSGSEALVFYFGFTSVGVY